MNKENEKLQKVNAASTQNVAGGDIEQNPLTGKWDVYDEKGHRIAYDLTRDDARYIDFMYKNRDDIEKIVRGEKTEKIVPTRKNIKK